MNNCWFWAVFVCLFLLLVSPGCAEEIAPKDWSGAAGLSVAVEGDGGTCPPTSHGHGAENPCSPLKIKGTETPSNGSEYSVEGGKAQYAWEISKGSINTATGEITSLNGACGSGTVTVTDSCGNFAKMDVRFPVGQWVLTSTDPGPCGIISGPLSCNSGTVVCSATISGNTKTEPIVRSGSWGSCFGGLGCDACVWGNHIDEIVCGGVVVEKSATSACGSNASIWVLSHTKIYTWSCP